MVNVEVKDDSPKKKPTCLIESMQWNWFIISIGNDVNRSSPETNLPSLQRKKYFSVENIYYAEQDTGNSLKFKAIALSFIYVGKRDEGLVQSYDKNPYTPPPPSHKTPKRKLTAQNATVNFNYKAIADQLRTVSRSYDNYPTGVVKPMNGITTFRLTTTIS